MSTSDLFIAIERGSADDIRNLVAEGADLDARLDYLKDHGPFYRGLTPLMAACLVPDERAFVVGVLLEAGADPSAVSEGEVTALWYAAGAGEWQKPIDQVGDEDLDWNRKRGNFAARLRSLLDTGGDPNETASNGRSALCEACAAGDPERVRMLLEAGAVPVPNAMLVARTREQTRTFVKEMAKESTAKLPIGSHVLKQVHTYMQDMLVGIDSAESFQIPLHQASEGGNPECVRLILATGFPFDYKDNCNRTALFYAASEEAAKVLLEAGVDPTSTDLYGRTALESAFEEERYEVATVLLKVFGDIDRYNDSWTQLHSAAFRIQPKAVKALVEAGADPHRRTKKGDTALHLAAWQGDSSWDDDRNAAIRETIRLLVGYGLDPNGLSGKGLAPLHEAAFGDWGSVPATMELLSLGADPNVRNKDGQTPLMVAADHGEVGCVRVLMEKGADTSLCDRTGRTALNYARQHLKVWKGIVWGKRLFRRNSQDHETKALDDAAECVRLLGGENPA